MSGLAPLTQLISLYLSGTSVSGDVSGLAPLTQLTDLELWHTSVSGDVSGLAPLTEIDAACGEGCWAWHLQGTSGNYYAVCGEFCTCSGTGCG